MYQSQFHSIWQDEAAVLSAPDSYALEFFEPPRALSSLITTFFFFRSDEPWLRDCQPANTGYMMIFLSGEAQARFSSGLAAPSQPVSLIGPTNAAMQYVVRGPLTVLGCAFTPLGWRAVTDMSAVESCDQFIDTQQLFGPQVDDLHRDLSAALDIAPDIERCDRLIDIVCGFLLPRLSEIPARHVEIVAAVLRWLDQSITPDVEALYASLPVARRQAQRIIGDYFGCAPKQLMRKYRAVRAAMLLNDPACSDEQAVQVQELFYDQPHMIREIRHFAGRTPSRLSGGDGTLLSMWLDKENIRELRQ